MSIAVVQTGSESPPVEPGADAARGSLLDRLRRQTERQQAERTLDVEIGGEFDPPLVARYGVLPVHELERFGEMADEHASRVEFALDVMARSNTAVLAYDDEGHLVELADERGAVTFGHRLAVLLGMPIPPGEDNMQPHEVIRLLFGGNGIALSTHGGRLLQWMQDPGAIDPGEA